MTISGALSNAMSGLRAAGRGAEVVSSNISNALTPGYGRRLLALSSSAIGGSGGVRIDGITRIVDAGLAADRRLADAEHSHAATTADFYARFEALVGTPDDPASISARVAGLEVSLITAASRPDAPERLGNVVEQARSLVGSINGASAGVQQARSDADRMIAAQVDTLNISLQQVQRLNTQITATSGQSGDMSSLLDQRQQVLDQIGMLVPVRAVPRAHGQIALYSTGGAVLLDGRAATIGFQKSNLVTPQMTLTGGQLSGLTVNGSAVGTGSDTGALRGGAIGAQFVLRDEHGVAAQKQLDVLARDLAERFQDPAVDPTLAPGDAGLFTDAGNPFDATNETGFSARLAVNVAVDPNAGGQAWRIRDGLNAGVAGNVGDATLLRSLTRSLETARVPGGIALGGGAFNASGLVSVIVSDISNHRTGADQQLSYAAARLNELTERQLADGVDTDDEIQRLMVIEQAYAANARVIEAVDEMMQTIMRL